MKKLLASLIIGMIVAGSLWAAGHPEKPTKGPIVVASKIDTEGSVLGEIIVQVLRKNGFDVVDKTQFGTTDVVRKAIVNGQIDIYPEYTGNGGFFFQGISPEVWKSAAQGYEEVKKLDYEKNKIVWLTPSPANNTWAIAVRKDLANTAKLVSLDDLGRSVNSGGTLKLAASEEFASRPDGLDAIEKAYGFKLQNSQLLLLSGGNTALTEKAAADGTEGVNAAMAYGTDGSLSALGLMVMSDPRGVQPVYEPTPIVREEIIKKYPGIEPLLDPVFKSLDLLTLQNLNAKVAIDGMDASVVASQYLVEKGFVK